MMLDIIVPHYKEPWSEVRKLFDMLALQRAVSFDNFRVLLVNDGGQCKITEDVFRQGYPYEVIGLEIEHQGVSAARNYGLQKSRAEWVMFCDCDDTFSSIYSLRSILDVLGTQDYDMLWMPFYVECSVHQNRQIREKYNQLFIHGKIFRRSFLEEHHLRFSTELDFSEDTAFLSLVSMEIGQGRIGEIKSEAPMYVWTFRPGSATTDPERMYSNSVGLFRRQLYVIQEYRKRDMWEDADRLCIRALCDAYITLSRKDFAQDHTEFSQEVKRFCQKEVGHLNIDAKTLQLAMAGAITESGVSKLYVPKVDGFYGWVEEMGVNSNGSH